MSEVLIEPVTEVLGEPEERRSGLDRRSGEVTAAREAQALRELLHDLSHSLGTVRMLAEAMSRRGTVTSDDPQWDQLQEELGYLARLTRSAVQTTRQRAATSVHAAACAAIASIATPHGVTVALNHVDTAFVTTDPDQLRRAVANLVQNASRAVGERGRVEIQITRAKREVEIRVDDDGPSFGSGTPGIASLGLRAVHRYATSVGGRLELGRSARGGARVSLVLPLTAAFRSAATPLQSV